MSESLQTNPISFDAALPEILNLLPDGVYVTDTQRQILFWNTAAERITGWRAADVIGRNCSDNLLVHIDKDGHQLCGSDHCPLHRSIVTGQPSSGALLVFAQRKGGSRAPVEVSVAPIRNSAGRVIGGIEIFRDATETMEDLLRAKAIQEQAVACPLEPDCRLELSLLYEPRDIVGGDFYRIQRLGEDQYAIMVADARGHGVAAALHTMQLRSLWDDHQAELESPARFLEVVSQRVQGLVQDAGFFATAVCASYDAARGVLRCVRAGHPAPLLFRRTGSVEAIGRPQLALGMVSAVRYVESTVQLAPDDALLLFTDGAVEVFDAAQNQLGVEGLTRLVQEQTAQQADRRFRVDVLEEQILRFSDSLHLPDDLTLVSLRRFA